MKTLSVIGFLASISPALGIVSTYSREWCTTKSGFTQPATLGTSTHALTTSRLAYETSKTTPSTTVTPPPLITTSTISSIVTTTLNQFTETATIFTTTTITTTSTSTEVETATTTTVQTPTSTVPTPPGFTPIASVTSPSAVPTQKVKRRAGRENRWPAPERVKKLDRFFGSRPRPRYPTTVACSVFAQLVSTSTIIYTASSTVSIIAPTPTITRTVTAISTSTVVPTDAPTTLSLSTTSTLSTSTVATLITTTTTTNTVTRVAPASTFYAACTPDNVVSSIGGMSIVNARIYNGLSFPTTFANGYDCCVHCITTTDDCAGTYFFDGSCYLLSTSGTCDPARAAGEFVVGNDTEGATISNGNCGQWSYLID